MRFKNNDLLLVNLFLSKFGKLFVNYYNQQNSINRLLTILKTFVNRYISFFKFLVVRDTSVFCFNLIRGFYDL